MDAIKQYYDQFIQFETNYDGRHWDTTIAEWVDIPIYTVCAYLLIVFMGPRFVKKPMPVQGFIALWNLSLSIFSTIGASRVVPHLLNTLETQGLRFTLCTHPRDWYLQGAPGFWTILFIFSKFPELIDTVNLILRKKPVGLLQWFHHATVLLYCWHSLHTMEPVGLWFAAMNYCVHSIMYFYFFLSYFKGLFKYLRNSPVAQFITVMQVTQMLVGVCVTFYAYVTVSSDSTCVGDLANLRMGLVMYLVYFVLFGELFLNRYIKPAPSKDGKAKAE